MRAWQRKSFDFADDPGWRGTLLFSPGCVAVSLQAILQLFPIKKVLELVDHCQAVYIHDFLTVWWMPFVFPRLWASSIYVLELTAGLLHTHGTSLSHCSFTLCILSFLHWITGHELSVLSQLHGFDSCLQISCGISE